MDHINPKKHYGTDDISNLALACIDCNLAKSSNIAGRDPETFILAPLYNPRLDEWDEHFEMDGVHIVGKTAVGRTTVYVLNMNSESQLELRAVIRGY